MLMPAVTLKTVLLNPRNVSPNRDLFFDSQFSGKRSSRRTERMSSTRPPKIVNKVEALVPKKKVSQNKNSQKNKKQKVLLGTPKRLL